MRVLFCAAPSVSLMGACGGVRKLMLLYEEALKKRGHSVAYLSPSEPPKWTDYDLCHLFMANGDSYSIGIEVRRHLPLVVSPIIDKFFPRFLMQINVLIDSHIPAVYTHLGRCASLCKLADALCLMSKFEGRVAKKALGVYTPAMIAHVAMSWPDTEANPERFADCGTGARPYVLFLGDAGNPRKNVERLVKSVAKLDVDLLIAGMMADGPTGRRIRLLVRKSPNIRLLGQVSEGEKLFLLKHASVFALPSLLEGIGLAATEAACAGSTVVITENGGPIDYFGNLAYYVSPSSIEDIQDKIKAALHTPLDASAQLRQKFTLERSASDLESCYTKAIAEAHLRGI